MTKIKVGIVGFGLSGRVFHFSLLKDHPDFDVVAVVTSKKKEVLSLAPNAKAVPTIEELLQTDIDLVIVCTPTHLHFEHAKASLEAGKHVVIEKPFASTVQECETLISLAAKKNLKLTVFQNRRYDSDFLTIQKLIKDGTLKDIAYYEAHFDRFKPVVDNRWKEQDLPGSGILYDLGAHLIDQALMLFGKPEGILADLGKLRNNASQFDYFHLILKYKTVKVVLHATALAAAIGPRFTIHSKSSSFVKYGLDPQEDQLKAGVSPQDVSYGIEAASNHGLLTNSKGETSVVKSEIGKYLTFYNLLASAIKSNSPLPVNPIDSVEVIKLIEQAITIYKN